MVEWSDRAQADQLVERAKAIAPQVMAVALAFGFVIAARLRRDIDRLALLVGVLYAAAAGWGTHWLLWLTPLALISARRWSAAYVVASSVYALIVYLGFGGILWGFTLLTNSLE